MWRNRRHPRGSTTISWLCWYDAMTMRRGGRCGAHQYRVRLQLSGLHFVNWRSIRLPDSVCAAANLAGLAHQKNIQIFKFILTIFFSLILFVSSSFTPNEAGLMNLSLRFSLHFISASNSLCFIMVNWSEFNSLKNLSLCFILHFWTLFTSFVKKQSPKRNKRD